MNNNLMFSSKNESWATPQNLFDELDSEFNFTLDPCCTKETAKCEKFYTEKDDGLNKNWDKEVVFMNPPYGRKIAAWIKKASETKGGIVVCLLPSRTDTRYFHDYIYRKKNVEIEFIKGRLIFGTDKYWEWVWEQKELNGKKNSLYKKYGKRNSAPFPSMIVIFK